MKYLVKYTPRVNGNHVQEIVNRARTALKSYGLDVEFVLTQAFIDETNPAFYEETNTWLGLKLAKTKSFASKFIAIFMEDGYDGVLLFLDGKVTLQKASLRGQHTELFWKSRLVNLMEIYSRDRMYVKPRLNKTSGAMTYPSYNGTREGFMLRDEYVFRHEFLHALEARYFRKDELHKRLSKGESIEEIEKDVAGRVRDILNVKSVAVSDPVPVKTDLPIKYYAIHHTASSQSSGNNQLSAVNKYHKERNWGSAEKPFYQKNPSTLGWWVGYNRFIDTNGSLTNTRKVGEETLAQVGHNCDVRERCDAISVCLAGNFDVELPNIKQIEALRRDYEEVKGLYPNIQAVFHKDLQASRTCAGRLFTKEYLDTVVLKTKKLPEPDPVDKEKGKVIDEEKRKLLEQIVVELKRLIDKLRNG
jgi:hypothetical protein